MIDLNTLTGSKTVSLEGALGINDRGQIVGYGTFKSGGSAHSFLLTPATSAPTAAMVMTAAYLNGTQRGLAISNSAPAAPVVSPPILSPNSEADGTFATSTPSTIMLDQVHLSPTQAKSVPVATHSSALASKVRNATVDAAFASSIPDDSDMLAWLW
jgi:hypothetical protein